MASIASYVADFKRDPQQFLPEPMIRDAVAATGHAWRDRVLGPVVTVQLMVLQVLCGNVSGRALLRLANLTASDSAYFAARTRLPIDVLWRVLLEVTHAAQRCSDGVACWHGHRVFTLDGSGVSMPDTPALRRAFGVPGRVADNLGFPVMHTLWMFDHATGLLIDFVTAHGHTHDMAQAPRLHPMLEAGDVLLADRAFGSYAHLALLLQENLHAVCRAHQRLIVNFCPGRKGRRQLGKRHRKGAPSSAQLRRLGEQDQLVAWDKPKSCPAWMDASNYARLPATITVRELRYRVQRNGFRGRAVTLVTTLLEPRKYSKADLEKLYETRWSIETNLRHLKTTMRMDVLRSKSVDGVQKELLAYAIAYNLVRQHMLEAATRQGVPPERVSFIDALDALRHGGPTRLRLNPDRPGRDEPRVIKRAKDRYTYMTKPRDALRQALGIKRIAA